MRKRKLERTATTTANLNLSLNENFSFVSVHVIERGSHLVNVNTGRLVPAVHFHGVVAGRQHDGDLAVAHALLCHQLLVEGDVLASELTVGVEEERGGGARDRLLQAANCTRKQSQEC